MHFYANNTGINSELLFTGSLNFQVKEIEVFELANHDPKAPLPPVCPSVSFDSVILLELPELLAEFSGKRFALLWRGSSDGFLAREFHRRCDGYGRTLTVILDENGNIFGGFTPTLWESRSVRDLGDALSALKGDDSGSSFLFTVKNMHGIPPRKFKLRSERRNQAILVDEKCGPTFGGSDLVIANGCDSNWDSWSRLGITYRNDTNIDEDEVLAGRKHFQVQEIEVFWITD
jgi:hypothetical protein